MYSATGCRSVLVLAIDELPGCTAKRVEHGKMLIMPASFCLSLRQYIVALVEDRSFLTCLSVVLSLVTLARLTTIVW